MSEPITTTATQEAEIARLLEEVKAQAAMIGRQSTEIGEFRQAGIDAAAAKTAQGQVDARKAAEAALAAPPAPPAVPPGAPEGVFTPVEAPTNPLALVDAEVAATGVLSDVSRQAVLTAGTFTADQLASYVQGRVALKAQSQQVHAEAVGGEDNLAALQAWVKINKSPQEIAALNTQIESSTGSYTLQGLMIEYASAVKDNPTMAAPAGSSQPMAQNIRGYSQDDAGQNRMRYDWAHRLYREHSDEGDAYRATIQAKMAASPWIVNMTKRLQLGQ